MMRTENAQDSACLRTLTSRLLSPAFRSTSTWSSSGASVRCPSRDSTSFPLSHTRTPPSLPKERRDLPACRGVTLAKAYATAPSLAAPGKSRPTASPQDVRGCHLTLVEPAYLVSSRSVGTMAGSPPWAARKSSFKPPGKGPAQKPGPDEPVVAAGPWQPHLVLELGSRG